MCYSPEYCGECSLLLGKKVYFLQDLSGLLQKCPFHPDAGCPSDLLVITGEVSPCPWDANFPSASQMSLPISCQDARGSWTGAPCPHASWRREDLGISFLHAGYAVVEQGPLREGFLKENKRALPGVFRDGGRAPPLSGLGTTFT